MRRDRLARSRLIRLLRLALLIIFISIIVFVFLNKNDNSFISPITTTIVNFDIPNLTTNIDNTKLRLVVQEVLTDAKGDYAIVIYNFKSGENYSFNEHKEFDSASLYKLWVMGATIEELQSGNWNENTMLSESIETLNKGFNIASESAERTEGIISLPVKTALARMITFSDNYSAILLSWKLKSSKITNYLKKNGFKDSSMGDLNTLPSTTAYDVALFFQKLYEGQLASSEYTQKMIDLLKKQEINHKIPKLLSEEIIVAHKTGELGLVTHDAGIVYVPKGDYIIVVLSKSSSPKNSEDMISKISKAVYDHFEK